MNEEKTERLVKWIKKHPFLRRVISCVVIALLLTYHGILCFLAMIGGVNYEYYHGKRIKWRK